MPAEENRCLTPDEIAAVASGSVTETERSSFLDHLGDCSECRRALSAAVQAERVTVDARGNAGDLQDDEILTPGSAVGRYVIEERIGAGGMGVVYRARDPDLKRPVVIKILKVAPVSPTTDIAATQRLLREAQAMARLSHPNVVQIYDVGAFDDEVFLAMEFVDGGTVSRWLAAEERAPDSVLKLFAQAGQGLAAAHRAGLIHRDFKPQNVLVTSSGEVKVADFGLARTDQLEHSARPRSSDVLNLQLTQTGAFLGTPPYTAPEQLAGDGADARSDQYSFCVSLWEALAGERPYAGATFGELLASIEAGVPRGADKIPERRRAALVRGLSSDPSERFETMEALLAALSDRRVKRPRRAAAIAGVLLAGGAAATAIWVGARASGAGDSDCSQSARATIGETISSLSSPTQELVRAYTDHWRKARASLCEQEPNLAVDDPRLRCLEHRRAAIASLADPEGPTDGDELRRQVGLLPEIDRCAQLDDAKGTLLTAGPPEKFALAESARRSLEKGQEALHHFGFPTASRFADSGLEEAREADAQAIEAELLLMKGDQLRLFGKSEEAREILVAAMSTADAAGHDRARIRAQLDLAVLVARIEPEQSQELLDLASGAIARTGDDETLAIDHAAASFSVAQAQGRLSDARSAAESLRKRAGAAAPIVEAAAAAVVVAPFLLRHGSAESARELATEMLTRPPWRDDRPDLELALRRWLAASERALGRVDRAIELHRETLATCSQLEVVAFPCALEELELARTLATRGDEDEALKRASSARELLSSVLGDKHELTGHAHATYGTLAARAGQTEAAISAYRDASIALSTSLGYKGEALARAQLAKAELEVASDARMAWLDFSAAGTSTRKIEGVEDVRDRAFYAAAMTELANAPDRDAELGFRAALRNLTGPRMTAEAQIGQATLFWRQGARDRAIDAVRGASLDALSVERRSEVEGWLQAPKGPPPVTWPNDIGKVDPPL